MTASPGLLVSVRSADEARAALTGGATLIDVKEPARGPLGRADEAVIAAVVAAVDGRRPVSAALGELADGMASIPAVGLAYVKWGLAGCLDGRDWRALLRPRLAAAGPPRVVLTAYADARCARAPEVEEVLALAAEQPGGVLLVDTFTKSAPSGGRRTTLLDWLPVGRVIELCRRARAADVRIALAGSLGLTEIAELRPAAPDWFAVRGAACAHGDRGAPIDVQRVAALTALLKRCPE